MKSKYIPEYLDEITEGLKLACSKLDLILEAIYGDNDCQTIKEDTLDGDNDDQTINEDALDTETAAPKKRGRKPKE